MTVTFLTTASWSERLARRPNEKSTYKPVPPEETTKTITSRLSVTKSGKKLDNECVSSTTQNGIQ
jgi:hypothetical protein